MHGVMKLLKPSHSWHLGLHPYMQAQVSCTFRNLWQAQRPSSEGQCYCHHHQMYLELTIGYVCTPITCIPLLISDFFFVPHQFGVVCPSGAEKVKFMVSGLALKNTGQMRTSDRHA